MPVLDGSIFSVVSKEANLIHAFSLGVAGCYQTPLLGYPLETVEFRELPLRSSADAAVAVEP
jgi:hypothetical protein